MRGDVDRSHLAVADFDPRRIRGGVDLTLDAQPGARGGSGDQLHDGLITDQRLAAPVLGDEREQPVLSSRAGGFHPRALLDPYLNLSIHTAPDVRPPTCRNSQWAKSFGVV